MPGKFDRCVRDVQAGGGDVNAYAVCTAAGTRGNPKRKCKACGDSKIVECPGCRRAGFVSRACIHCGGLGHVPCSECKVGTKKNRSAFVGAVRKDGKFSVQLVYDSGARITKVMTQQQIDELKSKEYDVYASSKRNPTEGKYIIASGVDDRQGFGRVSIDVYRPDGSLVDTWRQESQTLSADELFNKRGRAALRSLKSMYGVKDVRIPNQWKRGRKNQAEDSDGYAAAAAASEAFHGTAPHELIEVETDIFEHDYLGDIGELVKLEIIGVHGGIIDLKEFDGGRLTQSPQGYNDQLYITGGDQSVDLPSFGITKPHEIEYLGELKYITYYTIKHHLGRDGGDANYRHKFNDGGDEWVLVKRGTKKTNRPRVIYDAINHLLMLAGGEYSILPEGIAN